MAPSLFRPTMQGLPITRCLRGDPISAQARIKKEKEPEAVVLVPNPLAFMRVFQNCEANPSIEKGTPSIRSVRRVGRCQQNSANRSFFNVFE